jgi:hypothetical protein
MNNNDAYLEYFLSNRRMPAPAVRRERTRRRHGVWARAQKALSAR